MRTPFGSRVIITFLVGAVVVFGTVAFAINATPMQKPNVLADILFASTFSDADTRYVQTSLEWLREYLPAWYAYVADAKPLIFARDEHLQTRGIISLAKCCYSRGVGAISFGDHLGQWKIGAVVDVPGLQAQQIQFLSVLVHEVTHIRDVRAGRIEQARNARTCIAAERSANDQELEFARALTTVLIKGDATARANYRRNADKHLAITEENTHGVAWKIVCMLMYDE